MGRRISSVLLLTLCTACTARTVQPAKPTPTTASAQSASRTLCSITDDRITEASGIVASSRHDDVFFVHNDSGDSARFFAVGSDCRTLATYQLRGVRAVDWEDIARGPGPDGRSVLWLGDIGDNNAQRSSISVQRVPEPDPSTTGSRVELSSTTFVLTYPDGPHDAETLLADPLDGRIYVVTKNLLGPSEIYAAPLPLTASATLTPVTSFDIAWATGGDISPDGSKLVIRNYTDAYVFELPPTRLPNPLPPARVITLPVEPQGEAIAWTRDDQQLVITSEGRHPALSVVRP